MSMGGGNLPTVGAQALLAGARQFGLDAASVVNNLNKINAATGTLAAGTEANLGKSTGAYNKHASTVESATQRLTRAAQQGSAAVENAADLQINVLGNLNRANDNWAKLQTKGDVTALKSKQDLAFFIEQSSAATEKMERKRLELLEKNRVSIKTKERKSEQEHLFFIENANAKSTANQIKRDQELSRVRKKEAESLALFIADANTKTIRNEEARLRRAVPPGGGRVPPGSVGGAGAFGGGLSGFAGAARGASVGAIALGSAIGSLAAMFARDLVISVSRATASLVSFEKVLQPAIVFTEATSKQAAVMADNVLELGRNTALTSGEVAKLAAELSKEGMSFEQINTGALKAARNLQVLAAGELSASQAANVVSKALQAYNMTGAEADRVTQAIAGAAQKSAGSFGDYELALKRLTPVAGLLKIPVEEVTTAIALLNNAGLQGEQVGSNLLQLFLRLLNPTKESADIMQRYGLNLYDVDGRFIGLANTFQIMNRAFGDQAIATRGLTQAERDQDIASLGMSRSFLAALAIINRGPEAFDETLNSIKNFNVDENVAKFGDTLVDSIRIALNNVQALGIAFSSDLVERVKRSVKLVNQELQSLSIGSARGMGAGLGAMLEPLIQSGLNTIIKSVEILAPAIAVLADNISKIFESAGGWATVAAAMQFVADLYHTLQSGLAFFIAGIGVLIGKIPEIIPVVSGVIDIIAEVIDNVLTSAAENIRFVINSILTYINELAEAIGTDVPGAAQSLGRIFAPVAAGIITAAILAIKAWNFFGTGLQSIFKMLVPIVSNFITSNINGFKFVAERIIGYYVSTGKAIIGTFNDVVLPVLTTVGNFIINNIIPPIRDAILTIASAFGSVLDFIKDRIVDFLTMASNIPIVGQYFKGAADIIDTAGDRVANFLEGLKAKFGEVEIGGVNLGEMFAGLPDKVLGALTSIADEVTSTFEGALDFVNSIMPTMENIGAGMGDIFNEIRDSLANRVIPGLDGWLAKLRQIGKGAREMRDAHQGWAGAAAVNAMPTKGPPIPELGEPPGESSERFLKHIQELLRNVPLLTREMAEYVAELTQADRTRLGPIVAALNAQIPLITEILQKKRDILAIEIEIERVNQALNALSLQTQRIELQQRQALLPFDQALLALRVQGLQVQQQMLPIQNAIAAIDRQIEEINRENLDIAKRRILLEIQALPIRNAIADIDRRIAETQRTNFDLARRRLTNDAELENVNSQIADIQRRMEASHRENFELTRRRLQLELEVLRIDQQIAAVDEQITNLQRENYDVSERRLRIELDLLDPRNRIADIEKRINALGVTNYDLAVARARAGLDELPIKERIAELEQQINDTIDERQNLLLKRQQIIAEASVSNLEAQLKTTEDALESLWQEFSLRPTSVTTAALVPQIIAAEAERERLLAALRPARTGLEDIEQQQEIMRRTGELARIELELQKLAQEALLRPIQDRIAALEREQAEISARNDLTRLGLERERDLLEDIIEPMELILTNMEREEERRTKLNEITINGLNRQKQLLQDLQRPYQDQLNRIHEIGQITEITNQIADIFYQEEIQRLQDILGPLEDKKRAIDREQAAYDLRNATARLGLEEEKQRLENILLPIQDMIDAINRETEAERLRKELAVNGLLAQKQALQDLLAPLEAVQRSIEQQTTAITLQRDLVSAFYERQLLDIEAIRLSYEIYKNQLEILRSQEQVRLSQLIEKFQAAIAASGAFTTAEAAEVVKRMNFWSNEVDKIVGMRTEYNLLVSAVGLGATNFGNLGTAAGNTSGALATFITNAGNVDDRIRDIALAADGARNSLDPYSTTLGGARDRSNELKDSSFNLRGELVSLRNQFSSETGYWAGVYRDTLNNTKTATFDLKTGSYDLRVELQDLRNQITTATDFYMNAYRITMINTRTETVLLKDRSFDLRNELINLRNQVATETNHYMTIYRDTIVNTKEKTTDLKWETYYLKEQLVYLKNETWTAQDYMGRLRDRINEAAAAFRNFPRGTVNVSVSGFAEGGVVPGPYNAPMLAMVHGGERVIPTSAGVGSIEPTSVRTRSVINNYNNVVTNNYNFSASYEKYQDPVTVDQNLRSVVEMARR